MCTYSDIAKGGDSRVAWELARYMASNTDNDVWMICSDKEYKIKKDYIEPKLSVYGIKSKSFIEGINIFSPTLRKVNHVYKIFSELKPDIVHAHNIDPLSFVVQAWCMKNNVPFVYTGHLLATKSAEWQNFNLGLAIQSIISMGIDAYTKQYYKNCSKIICLNEFARQDFEEFTNDPEKLVVIPNGHIFRKIHKEVNMKDGKYRLLFPGYLSERKNQLFLINMMKHLTTDKKVELLFAGTFLVENYRKDIMKAIKNLPKNREVKLLGYVEHEKLLDMYKDIHYFVSAALAEVQSLAVIESLASGTPVIGLENTTTTELIQNNENGYILNSESSPKEFADKLSEYLEISEEKYENLSKRSKESVEFLDYSRISENYVDFYSDLITQPIDSRRKIISIKEVVKFFRIEEVEQKSKRYKNNVFLVIASSLVAIALAFVSVLNWVKRNKKE
jgi:glycosyltransferase involved in cell wall biosynthesis